MRWGAPPRHPRPMLRSSPMPSDPRRTKARPAASPNGDDGLDAMAKNVAELLKAVGEDVGREGLEKTPMRVARSLKDLTSGYRTDPMKVLNGAVYESDTDEMVVVKDIELYSLCEHHMLPFFGRAHVAYLPAGKIVGLSKLARLVDVYARRLQVQERLTSQIAEAVSSTLHPLG